MLSGQTGKMSKNGLSLPAICSQDDNAVILSERGPRRSLQPGDGESKDLRFVEVYRKATAGPSTPFATHPSDEDLSLGTPVRYGRSE